MTKQIPFTGGHTYQRIYAVVKKIPRGRVATYGQIAMLVGLSGQPRQVGYALNSLTNPGSIPWYRVINAKGEISTRAHPGCEKIQRVTLEREGIEFDLKGKVELSRFGWKPRVNGGHRDRGNEQKIKSS